MLTLRVSAGVCVHAHYFDPPGGGVPGPRLRGNPPDGKRNTECNTCIVSSVYCRQELQPLVDKGAGHHRTRPLMVYSGKQSCAY